MAKIHRSCSKPVYKTADQIYRKIRTLLFKH